MTNDELKKLTIRDVKTIVTPEDLKNFDREFKFDKATTHELTTEKFNSFKCMMNESPEYVKFIMGNGPVDTTFNFSSVRISDDTRKWIENIQQDRLKYKSDLPLPLQPFTREAKDSRRRIWLQGSSLVTIDTKRKDF
jgi:hypothetical protein